MYSFITENLPNTKCTATIGNFDGCHVGHQQLVHQNQQFARALGVADVVICFSPRAQEYFHPSSPSRELFTVSQKRRAMQELGVKRLHILRFNTELFSLTYYDFYEKVLKDFFKVQAITVGENFRFGHRRIGTAAWLQAKGANDGIEVCVCPAVRRFSQTVCSSAIRSMLLEGGEAEKASDLLGRPYCLEGIIARGDQMGRKLGFPTMNLSSIEQLRPRDGIYCGWVWVEGVSPFEHAPIVRFDTKELYRAVFHLGARPTLEDTEMRCEAHLLEGVWPNDEGFYGRRAGFYLQRRIRDIVDFDRLEALEKQIELDIQESLRTL